MSANPLGFEERCAETLRRHVEKADESTLNEAYELGREALEQGIGVLDLLQILWRAALDVLPGHLEDVRMTRRIEGFLIECLGPFEMAQRGAREANEALRKIDERREAHVRRVARELHDQAGQLLATVYLALHGLLGEAEPEARQKLTDVLDLMGQVEDEIRRVAHELRPLILDDLGLVPALRFLGEGVARRAGVSITVAGSTGGRLPAQIETELYRTTQEALNNIARHSHASLARIEVQRTQHELRLRVRDNGQGFDPKLRAPAGAQGGLGLTGISERLAPLGGAMEVHSSPGSGTELQIRIPLEVSHANSDEGSARG